MYDIRVLQPHFHRIFDDGKRQFLERFRVEELGYIHTNFYAPSDYWIAFGTKKGLEDQAEKHTTWRGRPVTPLEAVARRTPAGPRSPGDDEVVGESIGLKQRLHPPDPDYPLRGEHTDAADLWQIVHLDGSTTDLYALVVVPVEELEDYVPLSEAEESPLPFLNDGSPPLIEAYIAKDIYELLDSADYTVLEDAGQIIVAYHDGFSRDPINPRYRDLSN